MPAQIRVATFNVENLFARYRFRANFDPQGADGFGINNLAFDLYDPDARRITGRVVRAVDADIICLQEVEDMHVLERFNSRHLGNTRDKRYTHRVLIDSHDPRRIDVAVLSRYPITYVNTHRHERNAANTTWLFSRDCLEVDVDVEGTELSLYVNHLKSMMGGRDATKPRREEQAQRVADIVDYWWKKAGYKGNFVVLGDFNDYIDTQTSLVPLLQHGGLENVAERLESDERWTHYWAGGNEYRQLDYLFLSKSLAKKNKGKPGIERRGLPWRADKYDGERFDGVGENQPKASDHCPLYMDIALE